MKSERAKKIIDDDAVMMNNGDRMVNASTAYTAIDIAQQDAEERVREELTRWHDPKEVLPEIGKCVLVKVADQLNNEAIYIGSREGDEYTLDGMGNLVVGVWTHWMPT